MTGVYDRLGVRFLFPDNWTVTDEQNDQWPQSVTVESPGGAFWSLLIYEGIHAKPLLLAGEVLRSLRQVYDEVEAEQVSEQIGGIDTEGYDMAFYCLDLLVTAKVRVIQSASRSMLLLCQAEDREFGELEAVFRAITISLLQHEQDADGNWQ